MQLSSFMKLNKSGQILIEALLIITFCCGLLGVAYSANKKFLLNLKKNQTLNNKEARSHGKFKEKDY